MRKLSEYYQINEDLKIKGESLLGGDDKTYEIEKVCEDLKNMKELMCLYLDKDNRDVNSMCNKVEETIKSLEEAKSENWKFVKLFKGDWYPLMDDK